MRPVLLAVGALIFALGLLNLVAENATWRASSSQESRSITRSGGNSVQAGGSLLHAVSGDGCSKFSS